MASPSSIPTSDLLHARNLIVDETIYGSVIGAQAIATSGTIVTANGFLLRVTAAAAATGVILQAGNAGGQVIVIVNESAAVNTITFAASGTSNVAGGTGVSLAGLAAHMFVWDSGTSLWYQVGPATN